MINVFQGGIGGMDAIVFGEQHQANLNYFHDQFNKLNEFGSLIGNAGQRFMDNARNVYEQFNSDRALRLARAAIRQVKGIYISDVIQPFTEIGQMQAAPPVMQRWIMANPIVREYYHSQKCDGYSDTYLDAEPGKIGRDHYDWRRVMDGVVVETEDDWYYDTFLEELNEGDQDLDLTQKNHILTTWEIVEMYMKAGQEDPTSVWNSPL